MDVARTPVSDTELTGKGEPYMQVRKPKFRQK